MRGLLGLLLLLALPAWPQPAGLQAIKQRGTLVVAQYRGESLPYFFRRAPNNHQPVPEQNGLIGVDISLALEIANYLGVKLELQKNCADYDEVCQAVAQGQADLGISALSITPQRAALIRFSHPYASFGAELLINSLVEGQHGIRSLPDFYRLRALTDLTFALPQGTALVSWAQALFPKAKLVPVPLTEDAASYILQNDVLATLSDEMDNTVRFADNEKFAVYLQRVRIPTAVDQLAVAVPADNPDLLAYVNAVIDTHPLATEPKLVMEQFFPAGTPEGPEPGQLGPGEAPSQPVLPLGLAALALIALWLGLARPDKAPPIPPSPETIRLQRRSSSAPGEPEPVRTAWIEGLKNPWVSVAAALAGICLGLYQPHMALKTRILGELFVNLLALSALPIIVCAVIASISEALSTQNIGRYIGRTLVVFGVGAFLASAVGAFMAALTLYWFSPSQATLDTLGGVLRTQKIPTFSAEVGSDDVLKAIVPPNVFETFSSGHLLGIVLVSVLLGTSLGLLPKDAGKTLQALVTETHRAFLQILDWTIYLTPIGFCSLLAASVAGLGPTVIASLGEILILQYLGLLLLCALYLVSISRSVGLPLLRTIRLLKGSMVVAVVTTDPIPAIPLAMEEMSGGLQQPRRVGNFVIPLSVVMSGHNLAFQLSVMAVFVARIFGVQAAGGGYLLMVALAAFPGSLAGPSMPTLIAMVPFVLGPLALPVSPGMALILVTGPLIAPICGLHSLLAAVANSAIVSRTRLIPPSPSGGRPS